MKKTYKIEVDCANCAAKMEEATKKTPGVKDAVVNFMALKMKVEFEDGGCGLCTRQCHFEAITVTNNIAQIDYDKCKSCGLCAQKCPAHIITQRYERVRKAPAKEA